MKYKLCDKCKYHNFLIFITYLCCWNWCKVTVYSNEHVLIRSFVACRLFSLLFHQGIWAKCRIRSKSSKRCFSTQNLMKHQKCVPPLLFHQREKSAKMSKNEKRWLVSHLLNKFCTTSSQMFSRFLMDVHLPTRFQFTPFLWTGPRSTSRESGLGACIIWHPLNRIPTWQMLHGLLQRWFFHVWFFYTYFYRSIGVH